MDGYGGVFTYRVIEIIEFHIGGMSKAITEQARNEIYDTLEKLAVGKAAVVNSSK